MAVIFECGVVWGECVLLPREFFFNFQVKNAGFCIIFIAKNYLWSETRTCGGLSRPLGAEDIKRMGVENLAGVQLPSAPSTRYTHLVDGSRS